MAVRTRFAPSPTGYMHVGGVRTALFAWLYARQQGGQFLLRIEDTDKEREIEGSIGHIIESLRWLGIEWDEGPDNGGPHEPYIQSLRLSVYHEYAQKLIASGHAYPDPYSQEELEAFRAQADAEKRPFLFRDHRPAEVGEWNGSTPLRFRVPELKRYEWHDLVWGDLSAGEEALDDFILIKSDGYPTYNFAHIVDDIEMGITHVIRGEEFISSTPKFLSVYDAFGIAPPTFATPPVILGPDGKKKLSKRDGAKDLLEYRAEGYLPEAVVNYLAFLGWNPGTEQEIFSREELIEAFNFEQVHRSGAHFNEEKLQFINQQWMRRLSVDEFIAAGQLGIDESMHEKLRKTVPLLQERARTFQEAREMLQGELACLFETPTVQKVGLAAKEPEGEALGAFTRRALSAQLEKVQSLPADAEIEAIKDELMAYADQNPKEQGGRGAVLWPLRYALSGRERSPDPFTLIYILGKDEAILRIEAALAILDK